MSLSDRHILHDLIINLTIGLSENWNVSPTTEPLIVVYLYTFCINIEIYFDPATCYKYKDEGGVRYS